MATKLTTDLFIEKAKLVHGDKYDYSLVEYVNCETKVKIICSTHGVFEQKPVNHLSGYGCFMCGGTGKLNTMGFIKKAKLIHGDKYGYEFVEYVGNKVKVKILCHIHGVFEQKPNGHLFGNGCPKCGIITCGESRNHDSETFIKKAKLIHGHKYDYSEVKYINAHKKIEIICSIHGKYEQSPNHHLKGSGCQRCFGFNKTTEEFIQEAKLIHGNCYDYSLVKYFGNKIKIDIICLKHGEFKQTPNSHLNGSGCPKCKQSKGEKKISYFLNNNNIEYVFQKTFNNCKHDRPLFFDFYLPNNNMCIEFDGKQHFEFVKYFGGEEGLKIRQKRDVIKNNFCRDNNIELLRIGYDENIEEILHKFLN